MKKKVYIIGICSIINSICATAQSMKITGIVTDILDNPIAKANISFNRGQLSQTQTDEMGNFVIVKKSDNDSILFCSHINYKVTETAIRGNNTINFKLYPNDNEYSLSVIVDSTIQLDSSKSEDKTFANSLKPAVQKVTWTKVQSYPEFYGGNLALRAYYKTRIRLAKLSLKKDIAGTITLQFTVKKDGSLFNIKLIKGIEKKVDDEIIKSTQQLPKWRPAIQNGVECDYDYLLSIPVNLRISNL